MTDRNTHNEPICEYSDLPIAMCAHCNSGATIPSDTPPVYCAKPPTPRARPLDNRRFDEHWSCPLCDWEVTGADMNRQVAHHGVEAHPATFPAIMTVGQRLGWIIGMATEARQTVNHPNPADRALPTGGARIDSGRVPADLASISALSPGEGVSVAYNVPAATLVRCSRIVWDAFDPDLRAQHPQPLGCPPAIETEARWLADAWPDAQSVLDLVDIQYIDDDTAEVCAELARLTRTRTMPTIPCLVDGCHGVVQAICEDTDGWIWCDVCTDNHRVDRHQIARLWAEQQPVTLTEASGMLDIPDRTLRSWAAGGLIRSTGETRWKAPLYRIADIRAVAQHTRIRRVC